MSPVGISKPIVLHIEKETMSLLLYLQFSLSLLTVVFVTVSAHICVACSLQSRRILDRDP